jgi:hypothetical protein
MCKGVKMMHIVCHGDDEDESKNKEDNSRLFIEEQDFVGA